MEDERVTEGPAVAVKRGNARGAKRPCCGARTPTRRKARVNDKNTHSFARPEEEDIGQGEGRTNLAFLGTIRPRLQDGNASGSLQDSQEQQGRTWDRWHHVRRHRRKRSGEFSETDSGRTGPQHVSAHAGAEEGDSQGRGQQGPRSHDPYNPRPRGSGCA